MAITTPFSKDDPLFANIQNLLGSNPDEIIRLLNSSNLLVSLLHEYAFDTTYGGNITSSNGSGYDESGNIQIGGTGENDFIRLLGHELGHYLDTKRNDDFIAKVENDFDDIITYEMNESQATAISFIIQQQIKQTTRIDIKISNRIGLFDPDGTDKPGNDQAAMTALERKFGSKVSLNMTIADCWSLVEEVANDIWGKNLLTMPGQVQRWLRRRNELNGVYTGKGKEAPVFLQDSERTFQSAKIVNGQYQFLFKDKDGQLRAWVYEGTNGSDLAETGKRDLVTGKEAAGSSDTLHGGEGDDILYGGWTNDDNRACAMAICQQANCKQLEAIADSKTNFFQMLLQCFFVTMLIVYSSNVFAKDKLLEKNIEFIYENNIGLTRCIPDEIKKNYVSCKYFVNIYWIRKMPQGHWVGKSDIDIIVDGNLERHKLLFLQMGKKSKNIVIYNMGLTSYRDTDIEDMIKEADNMVWRFTNEESEDVLVRGLMVIKNRKNTMIKLGSSGGYTLEDGVYIPSLGLNYPAPADKKICIIDPDEQENASRQ